MSEMLGMARAHPKAKIFCATDFCNLFRCCIPNCILNGKLDWFSNNNSEKINSSLLGESHRKSMKSNSDKKQYNQFN